MKRKIHANFTDWLSRKLNLSLKAKKSYLKLLILKCFLFKFQNKSFWGFSQQQQISSSFFSTLLPLPLLLAHKPKRIHRKAKKLSFCFTQFKTRKRVKTHFKLFSLLFCLINKSHSCSDFSRFLFHAIDCARHVVAATREGLRKGKKSWTRKLVH